MYTVRADTLTFTLPQHWGEVTLGQAVTLMDPSAPQTTAFILTTLTDLTAAEFRGLKAFDLDKLVLEKLQFLFDAAPPIPQMPKTIQINGKTITLPTDLGTFATVGQMWDIDLLIRTRQKEELPVDHVSLADALLPVYLWPLLRDEPYTDRHEAAELWPELSQLSCPVGLTIAGFFLRSSLMPSPSGRVSIKPLPPPPTNARRWLRLPFFQRSTNTLPRYS